MNKSSRSFSSKSVAKRTRAYDVMSLHSNTTVSTAQVSIYPSKHAEKRQNERRVSFDDIQSAKKHAQCVSLMVICTDKGNAEKDAKQWATKWANEVGGGNLRLNSESKPPRAEVDLLG